MVLNSVKKIGIFLRKYFFLIILFIIFLSFFYFGFYKFLTLETLKSYRHEIEIWTHTNYKLSIIVYMLVFSLLIACAIPCATFLTLLGGFLFGNIAILYTLFSLTFGGMILFLIVRHAIGSRINLKSPTGWIKNVEQGFKRNAFNYLIALRLVPIFPCWISNVGAGVLNVKLSTFLIATVIGITPSTIIYVLAGRSLDNIFTHNIPLSDIIFTPSVILPLIGLAILSLIPVIYGGFKK